MDRKSIVQLSRIPQATTKEQVLRLLDAALVTALPALPGNAEQGDEDPFDEQHSTHLWIVSHAAALLKDKGKAGRRIHEPVNPHHPNIAHPSHHHPSHG